MKKIYTLMLLFFPALIIAQTPFTSSITPDLSAYGEANNYPGEGEYQIFLDTENGVFDKPIILVDGFDPNDVRKISNIYDSLNFSGTEGDQNLIDLLRAEGFDIVILNFPEYIRAADGITVDGGADFIERNAMLLVDLIDIVNTMKVGSEGTIIVGPSMGGLISRYALNYMEDNTLDADTRLWISFDAPHHGENIPIGLQHQLNYLAFNDLQPVEEIQPLIEDLLNSPAARQLLIDHYAAHLEPGSLVSFDSALTLPIQDNFRTIFENDINTMATDGFPSNVRKVAIVNGSGIGNSYFAMGDSGPLVSSGFTVLSTSLAIPAPPFGNVEIDLDIKFTPSAGTVGNVSTIVIDPPFISATTEAANSEAFAGIDGVDAAPGGLLDLPALTSNIDTGNPFAADFLDALLIDKFSFVPTVSALALEITDGTEIDWYHTINLANRATTNNTPFDNTYMPDDNEPHAQVNQENANFAMMEIMQEPLTISEITITDFRLESNPINDELVILSKKNLNANITVVDITGKIVFNTNKTLNSRTSIAVNLKSGFYILNISGKDSKFTTKFIKL